jgi:hypothetical protein
MSLIETREKLAEMFLKAAREYHARRDAEDARREAEDARREAEDARRELEDSRREAEDARRVAEDGLRKVEDNIRQLEDAHEADLKRIEELERLLAQTKPKPGEE